jgi:hypothetical protein
MVRGSSEGRHRGDYVLDRGEWVATCRLCGFKVSDLDRRQVASQFRTHIRESAIAAQLASVDRSGELRTADLRTTAG